MKNILSDMTVINNKAIIFFRLSIFEQLATVLSVFQVQKNCLEKLAHRSHEANVLTEPPNLSALARNVSSIFILQKQGN